MVIFIGIMNTTHYTDILDAALVLFIQIAFNRTMTQSIPANGLCAKYIGHFIPKVIKENGGPSVY